MSKMGEVDYATKCGECEDVIYLANNENFGLCDKLGDCCGPVYRVKLAYQKCIYAAPGIRINEREISNRIQEAKDKQVEFEKSLQRAREIIAGWPEWKRNFFLGTV
ncbi:hypothetical protein HN832_05095 [archaeon]|jgi:hypothetical protein|nr:hypothetical protein [archaeon]MBT4373743.1 hypothetical protein [archaeon]MBT4532209.1 hypothetical protein [archaeon]MBT7001433.1 hypothetical protein [archaeon]MBT7282761.1 hypothetical protein [archaeon]